MKKMKNNVSESVKVSIDKETITNLLDKKIVDTSSSSERKLAKFIMKIAEEAGRLDDIARFALTGYFPDTKYSINDKFNKIYPGAYYFFETKNDKGETIIDSKYKPIENATIVDIDRFASKPYKLQYELPIEKANKIVITTKHVYCSERDLEYYENE